MSAYQKDYEPGDAIFIWGSYRVILGVDDDDYIMSQENGRKTNKDAALIDREAVPYDEWKRERIL